MAGTEADGTWTSSRLDCQTGYHAAAYRTALDGLDPAAIKSPSGGAFAQNPYFCAGLVNAARSHPAAAMTTPERSSSPNPRFAAAHQGCTATPSKATSSPFSRKPDMAHPHAAIVGTGQTPFRRAMTTRTTGTGTGRGRPGARGAGIGPDEVDAIVFSMAPTQFMGVADVEKWAVDYTWARGKPFLRIPPAARPAAQRSRAAAGRTRRARTGLVVGADRITETPDAQFVLNLIWDQFYEQDFALNTVTMTALAAQRYMHKNGTTEEQFARVVVRSRATRCAIRTLT